MCDHCNNLTAKHIQKAGEYWGYPQCCIDDFKMRVDRHLNSDSDESLFTPEQDLVTTMDENGGFVPCPAHCIELLANLNSKGVEDILVNRQAVWPYPEEDPIHQHKWMVQHP